MRRNGRYAALALIEGGAAPPSPPGSTGEVSFPVSADHAAVTSYEIRAYLEGSPVLAGSTNIGKPTPVGGVITVNISSFLATLEAGNYVLTVAAISPGGTSESDASAPFSLPLA